MTSDPHQGAAADPSPFPAADHDHARCSDDLIARAEALCRARGLNLSLPRRRVLGALAVSHAPIGAYEIIDRLAETGARPAPISVYRALGFLTEAGLAHRIERLNAYVACGASHGETGALVFLICESCRQVGEVAAQEVGFDLARLDDGLGFAPRSAAIEITGLCAECRRGAAATA